MDMGYHNLVLQGQLCSVSRDTSRCARGRANQQSVYVMHRTIRKYSSVAIMEVMSCPPRPLCGGRVGLRRDRLCGFLLMRCKRGKFP